MDTANGDRVDFSINKPIDLKKAKFLPGKVDEAKLSPELPTTTAKEELLTLKNVSYEVCYGALSFCA